jgi:hypothetical protein
MDTTDQSAVRSLPVKIPMWSSSASADTGASIITTALIKQMKKRLITRAINPLTSSHGSHGHHEIIHPKPIRHTAC